VILKREKPPLGGGLSVETFWITGPARLGNNDLASAYSAISSYVVKLISPLSVVRLQLTVDAHNLTEETNGKTKRRP
jgi:hypothetical protein